MFELTESPIEQAPPFGKADGALVVFDGIVRDHNDGREVLSLDYEAMPVVAEKEGRKIVAEALAAFEVSSVSCVHRVGALQIGDVAVRVGVAASHRGEAFAACQYVIDEVKRRVPIWKRERYADGSEEWVNAAAGTDEENSPAVFLDCMGALAGWTIIDVREEDERTGDPIVGFEHLVSPKSRFDRGVLGQGAGKPLLVCARGVSALLLADDLRREGIHAVWSLTGGCMTLKHIARKS